MYVKQTIYTYTYNHQTGKPDKSHFFNQFNSRFKIDLKYKYYIFTLSYMIYNM